MELSEVLFLPKQTSKSRSYEDDVPNFWYSKYQTTADVVQYALMKGLEDIKKDFSK